MLIIEPYGGLGNRMRVINSAVSLARKLNRMLIIIWKISRELKCPIRHLFSLPNTIIVRQYHVFNRLKKYILMKQLKKNCRLMDQQEIITLINQGYDFTLLNEYPAVYINTYSSFYPYLNFNFFNPIPKIQNQINQITQKFGSNIIGIHIRRQDNKMASDFSKTEYFIKSMEDEIMADANVCFYLATDSIDEEQKLLQIFPDKIITHPKEWCRDKKKGVQDALVDLMCLANTRKLLASYYSSFSDIAAEINKIEKIEIGFPH